MDGVTMVRNFYEPIAPVNWSETLAEYYAHEAKQLEEHHANLRERDQQMVDKVKREDPIKTLEAIASTTKAVGSLVGDIKKAKAQKEVKTRASVQRKVNRHEGWVEEIRKSIENYPTKREELFKNTGTFHKFLKEKAVEAGSPELAADIDKMDARQQVILREILAQQFSFSLNDPIKFENWQSKTYQNKPTYWKKWEAKSSALKQEEINNWKAQEISKYGISDELIDTYVVGEIHRQDETAKGTNRAKAANAYFKTRSAKAKVIFGTSSGHVNPLTLHQNIKDEIISRSESLTDIEGGPTKIQQATDSVLADLRELNLAGFIPPQALIGLKEFKFEHPAGGKEGATIPVAFFDKDGVMFNQFVNDNRAGQLRLISTKKALDINFADETERLAHTGGSQDQIDKRIQQLENRGLISTERINDLKNINVAAQTPNGYKATWTIWEPKLASGLYKITQTDIDDIKNDKVKAEVQRRFDQLEAYKKKTGINHIGTYDSTITQVMTGSALGKDENATGVAAQISAQLDREAQVLHSTLVWAQYDAKGNLDPTKVNNEIAGTVTAYKDGLWASRGGGTKGKDGLYSFDERAKDFTNWRIYNNIRIRSATEHKINWTPANQTKWRSKVDALLTNTYKGNREAAIADGAGLDNIDLAGVALTGDYSDKMYVIAERLNTDVKTLFNNAVKRLNDSKDPKDNQFTRSFGFEKLERELKQNKNQTANDVILEGLNLAYKSVKGKPGFYNSRIGTLRYQLRTQGWKNLSTNKQVEVIGILQKSVEADPEIQPLVEAKKEEKAAQLLEINKKNARIKENQRLQNTLSPAEYFSTGEGFQGFMEEPKEDEDTN